MHIINIVWNAHHWINFPHFRNWALMCLSAFNASIPLRCQVMLRNLDIKEVQISSIQHFIIISIIALIYYKWDKVSNKKKNSNFSTLKVFLDFLIKLFVIHQGNEWSTKSWNLGISLLKYKDSWKFKSKKKLDEIKANLGKLKSKKNKVRI
jgi:hypothetical protein